MGMEVVEGLGGGVVDTEGEPEARLEGLPPPTEDPDIVGVMVVSGLVGTGLGVGMAPESEGEGREGVGVWDREGILEGVASEEGEGWEGEAEGESPEVKDPPPPPPTVGVGRSWVEEMEWVEDTVVVPHSFKMVEVGV